MYNYTQEKKKKRTLSHKQVYIMRIFSSLTEPYLASKF